MTTTTTVTELSALDALLPAELLARMDERAPIYDRENSFFTEDFEELRANGFLNIAVPTDLGGAGMGLHRVSEALRRVAYVAPATALALNMHLYWTGVAADMLRRGDDSARFILEEAAKGKVFAALHGEVGNEVPLLLATTTAERVDGGWKLNGHKIFGSLSPVWDYGGFHAMDASDPAAPKIVHGFVMRDSPGVEIVETWDTLGMRATQSHDTLLHDAIVPDELVVRVSPVGFAGADLFQLAIFAWALTGFASVYHGIARRAFDLTVDNAQKRTSLTLTRSMAHHPEVQHNVADMRIALDASEAYLDRTAGDWADMVDHPDWPIRLIAMRSRVISESFEIVDRRWTSPAAAAPSSATAWSSSSVTCGWAASTPATRSWPTR
jgi:alkylation response protein AidB-like acyl-CoA dehydrogenase